MTTTQVSEPPTARARVRTTDVDEARDRVTEVFCPHDLAPVGRSRSHRIRFDWVKFGAVGLCSLDYGGPVRISPEEFRTFLLVQIPLAGRALVRSGDEEVVSDPSTASVPDPDRTVDMEWGAGNRQLIVRLDRAALDRQASVLGHGPAPRLPVAMDLTTPAARSWRQTVDLLRADAEHDRRLDHPVLRPQLEQMVITQLLLAHAPTATVSAPRPAAAPRLIRRADELIAAHAREPLTVEDMAEAVGLSVRALQEGFRRHLATTPTERLREVRLAGVHAELDAADPSVTTVSAVANDWGFAHLGRFSVAYRRRFGCSPSETLRA